jgi:cob(I)alamin adenosyltransferase
MKVYTKTGDGGQTGLFGGARVDKDEARIEASGTVDETNSAIGLARAAGCPDPVSEWLVAIQADLFVVGAELSTAIENREKLERRMGLISDARSAALEQAIDRMEEELEPLTTFILPAGCPAGAALHHARTVARRAERLVITMRRQHPVRDGLIIYLNRLSDFLFVAARFTNQLAGAPDTPWLPEPIAAESPS